MHGSFRQVGFGKKTSPHHRTFLALAVLLRLDCIELLLGTLIAGKSDSAPSTSPPPPAPPLDEATTVSSRIASSHPAQPLDEATSALDSEVETIIQEQLFNLMEGKTVLAIAHRLSTIANMDRLIVLDAGKIIEQGTHSDLVAADGLYASLWARQSGGFLDLDDETETKE